MNINTLLKQIFDLNLISELPKNYGIVSSINIKENTVDFNTNIDIDSLYEIKFIVDYILLLGVEHVVFVIRTKDDPFLDTECPNKKILNDLDTLFMKNGIKTHHFIQEPWPNPVPKFKIDENMFILRFGFDESCVIDKIAVQKEKFKNIKPNVKCKKIMLLLNSENVLSYEI